MTAEGQMTAQPKDRGAYAEIPKTEHAGYGE